MPDAQVAHEPEACAGCGGDLAGAERVADGEESRQVFDLPEEIVLVADRARRRQPAVQVLRGAQHWVLPAGVAAPVQYGPSLHALGVTRDVFQHIPYDRARQLILDLTGSEVSSGTLKAWVDEAAAGLTEFDEQLRGLLSSAPVVHFDETGARIAGRLGWIHSASTEELTRYTSHAKRGVIAIDAAGVLGDFHGVAVHDGWKPYSTDRSGPSARRRAVRAGDGRRTARGSPVWHLCIQDALNTPWRFCFATEAFAATAARLRGPGQSGRESQPALATAQASIGAPSG